MSHKYTRETLYHFTCENCYLWWTYAHTVNKYDYDRYPKALKELTCPHCGHRSTCKEKSGASSIHEKNPVSRAYKTSAWQGENISGWQPNPKDFNEKDE
jgi:DNA-directed RNA polymerase subunit RPC12/RpoP